MKTLTTAFAAMLVMGTAALAQVASCGVLQRVR